METQARATDPMTSKLAAVNVNTASCDRDILNYLSENGPANTYVLSQMIERKETTVSSACSRLCREDKIHQHSTAESSETGCDRIVWAFGPDPSGCGSERKMPVRQTGHNKVKFKPFTEAEIEVMGKAAGKYIDIFTTLLNCEIERRLNA